MTTGIEIRDATTDDAAAIARCYRRAYATAADLGYRSRLTDVRDDTVRSWLEADGETLVAEVDGDDGGGGDVIGTVRFRDDQSVPTVERLAVVPDHQRTGIATQLLERAETLARARGDGRVRLTTFADHPFLLEWYERRGYTEIDCPESTAWAFEFVLLEKPLSSRPGRPVSRRP